MIPHGKRDTLTEPPRHRLSAAVRNKVLRLEEEDVM